MESRWDCSCALMGTNVDGCNGAGDQENDYTQRLGQVLTILSHHVSLKTDSKQVRTNQKPVCKVFRQSVLKSSLRQPECAHQSVLPAPANSNGSRPIQACSWRRGGSCILASHRETRWSSRGWSSFRFVEGKLRSRIIWHVLQNNKNEQSHSNVHAVYLCFIHVL